jgi:hypothetical protein
MEDHSVALPSVNILTNKFAVKERWLKLYRKIFHIFMQFDIVHVIDFRLILTQLNARMAAIEANMAAGDAAVAASAQAAVAGLTGSVQTQLATLSAQMLAHTHPYVSPAGPAVTDIPAGLAGLSSFSVPKITPPAAVTTGSVQYTDSALKSRNSSLLATGPATAPLAEGFSVEEQQANVEITTNIGF